MMREYFQEDFAFSFTRMIYEYAFLNPNNIFTKEPTKNTSYPYNFNILDIRRKVSVSHGGGDFGLYLN